MDTPSSNPTVQPWRDRLHEIIFEADTPKGKAFDVALIIAIFASVAVVILSTMPSARIEPYDSIYLILEWCFTAVFTAEYILRIIVVRKPMRYALSFFGIIDLLSILPAFVGIFIPGSERLLVVRTLRLLRIFRVFKLARYLTEANALKHALYQSRHKLAVFMATILIVVLITSAAMHVAESTTKNPNPNFDSMPKAMYWAVITMTTVGYGDVVPTTAFGKIMTTMLVLVGYSMIIIPTGVLSAEITSTRNKPITTRACPSCMKEGLDLDAVFCKRCGERLDP